MIQLVYTSIVSDAWDGDIYALCEHSARNNAIHEITGAIVRENNTFLHAVEGPRVPVEDTFLRIIKDTRHHSLRLLSRRDIALREFGYGAMADLKTLHEKLAVIQKISVILGHANVRSQDLFYKNFKDLIDTCQNFQKNTIGENRAIATTPRAARLAGLLKK